jgi:TRAP-type C4-dicarboxylate transport system permease small subunit
MRCAKTFFTRFSWALSLVGQGVLAFMVITICYDSLMRYVFFAPTSWSLEINTFLIIYVALMTAADVQREDAHIRITFFSDKVGPAMQRVIRFVIGLVGALFCAIMAWYGGEHTLQAVEFGERVSSSLGTPMVFPYAMLPIGFGALALQFLIDAFGSGRRVDKTDAEDTALV